MPEVLVPEVLVPEVLFLAGLFAAALLAGLFAALFPAGLFTAVFFAGLFAPALLAALPPSPLRPAASARKAVRSTISISASARSTGSWPVRAQLKWMEHFKHGVIMRVAPVRTASLRRSTCRPLLH